MTDTRTVAPAGVAVPGLEPRQMRTTEPPRDLVFHLVVEAIGTLALVFLGVCAIATTNNLVAIGLAHGLAIALMVAATGHISGGAFNPAVTLALLIARKLSAAKAGLYVLAQLLGATAGAILARMVIPNRILNNKDVGFGIPAVGSDFDVMNAFTAEIVATFFLTYVIFGVAIDRRGPSTIAALCIGLMIAADIFAVGAVSGAAMNPARWFGPAILEGQMRDFWVWWLGPAIGASLAAALYYYGYLRGRDA